MTGTPKETSYQTFISESIQCDTNRSGPLQRTSIGGKKERPQTVRMPSRNLLTFSKLPLFPGIFIENRHALPHAPPTYEQKRGL